MKHTVKMLLIPENVYASIMNNTASKQVQQLDFKNTKPSPRVPDPVSGESLDEPRLKIKKIIKNRVMNPDAKLLHYTQQYKRYRKLLQERNEHPISVKMENLTSALQQTQTPIPVFSDQIPDSNTTTINNNNNNLNQHETPSRITSKNISSNTEKVQSFSNIKSPAGIKSSLLDYVASNYRILKINNHSKIGTYVDYLIDPNSQSRAPNGYPNFYQAAKLDPNINMAIDMLETFRNNKRQHEKTQKH